MYNDNDKLICIMTICIDCNSYGCTDSIRTLKVCATTGNALIMPYDTKTYCHLLYR